MACGEDRRRSALGPQRHQRRAKPGQHGGGQDETGRRQNPGLDGDRTHRDQADDQRRRNDARQQVSEGVDIIDQAALPFARPQAPRRAEPHEGFPQPDPQASGDPEGSDPERDGPRTHSLGRR